MSNRSDFQTVMDLIVKGVLEPALDMSFPLQDAADAQERLWQGDNFGKITLDIG
jgi:NADPH:quinone reductase-like Zn-dependent oxidoreductase